MTAEELIEELKKYPSDLPIRILETGYEKVRDIEYVSLDGKHQYCMFGDEDEMALWLGW